MDNKEISNVAITTDGTIDGTTLIIDGVDITANEEVVSIYLSVSSIDGMSMSLSYSVRDSSGDTPKVVTRRVYEYEESNDSKTSASSVANAADAGAAPSSTAHSCARIGINSVKAREDALLGIASRRYGRFTINDIAKMIYRRS